MTTLIVGNAAHLDLILLGDQRPGDSDFGLLDASPGRDGIWCEGGASMTIALSMVRTGAPASLWHPVPGSRLDSADFGRLREEGVVTGPCPVYQGEPVRSVVVHGADWRLGWSAPPAPASFAPDNATLTDVTAVVIAPVWGDWTDAALGFAHERGLPATLVGFSDDRALGHVWDRIIVDEEQAAGLGKVRAREWIITDGANGARIVRDGRQTARIPACPAKVVDTTGAGDTFAGTYLGGIATGLDSKAAGRAAARRAARVCETWGSRPERDFFNQC